MKIELSIGHITETAQQKREENLQFRYFLEQRNSSTVDHVVHRLAQFYTKEIDCLLCGNCCKNLRPQANYQDMKTFVSEENMRAYKYRWGFACKNLDDKRCTIYPDRPLECHEYPYLHRNQFISRLTGIMQNYEICPIVFHVFESLKKEFDWRNI